MREIANINRALAVEEGIELQCLAREMLVSAQRLCRHLEGLPDPNKPTRLRQPEQKAA